MADDDDTSAPYQPPPSLWQLIESFTSSHQLPDVKCLLGESLVEQSIELHREVSSYHCDEWCCLWPYSIWPNLDSDSQWIRIWIHWHIERYGFVNVVECHAIVVCLCWWCWCDVILLLSISGFASESVYLDLRTEWTFSLNPTRIQTRIRQIEYGVSLCEHFCLLLVEEQLQHLYCSICCKWNRNKKQTCQ